MKHRTTSKSKHEILKEFALTLWEIDPMFIRSAEDPPMAIPTWEYDNEALSIFSRFSESALQLAADQTRVVEVARAIVKETFNFWFSGDGIEDDVLAHVTDRLLHIYLGSFVDQTGSE